MQLVFEQDWQHALWDLLNLAVRRTPIPCVVPFALWDHLCQAPEDLAAVASNLTDVCIAARGDGGCVPGPAQHVPAFAVFLEPAVRRGRRKTASVAS